MPLGGLYPLIIVEFARRTKPRNLYVYTLFIYICMYMNEFIIIMAFVHIIYHLIDIISYMYFIIFVVGMNMDIMLSESSPEKFVSAWMSFVILRMCSEGTKLKF